MADAYDFSWARPDFGGTGARLVLAYANGGKPTPTAEYMAGLRAQGIGVCLGWETTPFRSLDGYDAGRVDARRFEDEVTSVDYPVDVACWACASDGNRDNPGPDGAITAYFQGWAEVMHPARPGVVAYGNRNAIDSARGAPRVLGGWCPSTWNRNDDDLLIQHADGDSGPFPGSAALPGTDANTIQHDFPWWGATLPPSRKVFDMADVWQTESGHYLVQGEQRTVIAESDVDVYLAKYGPATPANDSWFVNNRLVWAPVSPVDLAGTPLVVPPLAPTSSTTAKNMAAVLRKTTLGRKG